MIDVKSFMEFFEKEYNVTFVDIKTGKKGLDLIAKKEQRKNPYNDPSYKSDYNRFLEENGEEL